MGGGSGKKDPIKTLWEFLVHTEFIWGYLDVEVASYILIFKVAFDSFVMIKR